MIAIDLSKQQALDADPRAIQQINFTANLDRNGNTRSKRNCFGDFKRILIPLGLTAAPSAADTGIHKKILGSGNMTTLIILNDEIEDIIKIVKSLEDSGLLLKGVTETVQNKVKEQKGRFLSMY